MGISVKDVNAHEFTKSLAAFLKKWVLSGEMYIIIINCVSHKKKE